MTSPEMLTLAKHIANNSKDYGQDATAIARALLSSSKRIEELEKALGEMQARDNLNGSLPPWYREKIDALSPSNGGGEMAQPQTASRSPASERSAK